MKKQNNGYLLLGLVLLFYGIGSFILFVLENLLSNDYGLLTFIFSPLKSLFLVVSVVWPSIFLGAGLALVLKTVKR